MTPDARADACTWVDGQVAAHGTSAIELGEALRSRPELGYDETYAAERSADWLRSLGLTPRTGLAGTGVRLDLDSGRPGPTVAVLGELDAVHLPTHPEAAADGAAPACGHHASLAAACLATVAAHALLPRLSGRLVLLLVPAEEMLSPVRLAAVRATGRALRPTGKTELLRLGELDDVDLAMMVHTGREGGPRFSVGDTLRGAVSVTARFLGTAAHGGSSPELGVDAVRAARHALDALDRIDPVEGRGIAAALRPPEAALGSVPAECSVDVLVRGTTVEDLRVAVTEVEQALRDAARRVGARVHGATELAYAPTRSSSALDDVVARCATEVVGPDGQARGRALGASSDIGDLSLLMPVTHAYSSGAEGHHHSASYRIVDHERAVLEPARYLARAVVELLSDDASGARRVLAATPTVSRTEYAALRASFETSWRHAPDPTHHEGGSV